MATDRPPINPFSALIEEMIRVFETDFCEDRSLESHANDAGRAYNEDFKRPYICTLMADVMTGRWQMGTSQEEVSKRLGILSDRAWVSHALRRGQMSMDVFMRLRCWPLRPQDWEPDVNALKADMGRSGFMAVARVYADLVTNRPTLIPGQLDELTYELVCELLGTLSKWSFALVRRNTQYASQLVNNVCADVRRNICPMWYTPKQRRATESEVTRITSDPLAAFNHLRRLTADWLDVFVVADAWLEQ